MNSFKILILAVILGALAGALASTAILNIYEPNKEDLMRDFYLAENYIHVSPHTVRKDMDQGNNSFILVDLRSQEEYGEEHIIGAVNIPAYRNPDTSAYEDVDRIVAMFRSLQERNPGKDIIVYCYSIPCMTGRKVGKMLAEHGIYVKHLGIGWNEWRYYWDLWNHGHEWNQTNVDNYILSGSEPGIPKIKKDASTCAIEGGLGC